MIKSSDDPDFNKIMNLIRFNANFSKFSGDMKLQYQSPDYILEKYNHWIGFDPKKLSLYTPDGCTDIINKYAKTWGSKWSTVRSQLIYLHLTNNLNLLNMVRKFEEYIGDISMLSPYQHKGLHPTIEMEFIPIVIEKNRDNIQIVLRDMKLKDLIS